MYVNYDLNIYNLDNFIDRGNGKRKLVKKKSISVLSKTVQNSKG